MTSIEQNKKFELQFLRMLIEPNHTTRIVTYNERFTDDQENMVL